ncbi:MAG: hypothetical protein WC517_01110 [Patescibacteria group bacterium]
MHALIELVFEILMIIVGLGIFAVCVGLKVSCPNCGKMFYYHHKSCPDCGHKHYIDE